MTGKFAGAHLPAPQTERYALHNLTMKQNTSEIKRLVLAKALYLHGCAHAFRSDSVSRMLAIHHFDNAIEIILKTLATRKRVGPERQYFNFPELLKKIVDLPLKEQLSDLHSARNNIQHQGDIPSIESVIKYKGYTEDFFREVCYDQFNISYERLFLSQLIDNQALRSKAIKAEEAFERQEHKLCIVQCDEVLLSAVFEEADLFSSAGELTGYWGASDELRAVLRENYAEKYKGKDFYDLARELRGAILQWGQAATGMQFLDEYRMDFLKHRQMVKALDDLSDSELRDNAEFSLNFVTGLILKWQEQGVFKTKDSKAYKS